MKNWDRADRTIVKIILSALMMFCLSDQSFAVYSATEDISKIGVGARPMGMGKAYVSVAEDVNSIFMNPAGLTAVDKFTFTSMYTSMFEGDLNYVVLGAAVPLRFAKVGLGVISTGTSQIPSPTPTSITYFDYFDRLYILSMAPLEPARFGDGWFYSGANFKLYNKGFTDTARNFGNGVDLDLGMQYKRDDGLALGLCVQNMLPNEILWDTGARDDIPIIFKAGVSNKFFEDKLLLALDADVSTGRNLPTPFHLGLEYTMNKYLTLRAGADQQISAASSVYTNLTAGVGINIAGIRIDYAYHTFADSSFSMAHFVSLSY